jgi:hypothetical protein
LSNETQYPPAIPKYRRLPVISSIGATLTLSADQSGSLVLLDRAGGRTITLPTTPRVGTFFDFACSVTNTTPSYKVITGSASELMVGSIINCDTDTSDGVAIWKALVGSSYISVILNGTTTGGIKGDSFRCTCLNSTTWLVTGVTNGTSTVATPFSAS